MSSTADDEREPLLLLLATAASPFQFVFSEKKKKIVFLCHSVSRLESVEKQPLSHSFTRSAFEFLYSSNESLAVRYVALRYDYPRVVGREGILFVALNCVVGDSFRFFSSEAEAGRGRRAMVVV